MEGEGICRESVFLSGSAHLRFDFFDPPLPPFPPRLRKWQALNIRSNTTHADSYSLSLSTSRLIRFAKRVYKLEHALVRGFLRVLLFIRARRTLQCYLHFHVESLVNFVLYVGKERDSFKSLRYFN